MNIGWYGYGGNSWQADQFRDEFALNGIKLHTCHEYPNADVKFTVDGLIPFVDSMDAIILPARHEVQPSKSANRLGQAWSRGKACIVAPLPAYLKYARHNENALVATERSDWLKHALDLRDHPQLRVRLGSTGKEIANKHLHPRDLVHHFLSAVQQDNHFLQIIIPHYSERVDYVAQAAESALLAEGPKRDILIVTSARTDLRHSQPIRDLMERHPNFRVHHSPHRLSFSAANNAGLKMLHPDTTHILLLNDDTIVSRNALSNMVSSVGDKEIILNPYSNCDQGWLHQDQLVLGSIGLHPGMAIEQFSINELEMLREFTPSPDRTLVPVPFCAMYGTMMSKKVFEKIGFLAEDFSNGGEDADYSYRAQALGVQTFWTRSAFIFHFGGRTRKFAQDQDPNLHQIEDQHNNFLLQKKWIRNQKRVKRIAIWTGPAWETWGLDSYKTTGIGGSETCAGRLAEIAAANGHQVTLYGQHEESESNGVMLRPYAKFAPDQEYYDLFIASRNLAPFDVGQIRAKKKLVWVHDIWLLSGQAISAKNLDQIDKFICLSPWHEAFFSHHHKIDTNKIAIIPNGINSELFKKSIEHKVHGKMHFSSSPDRGLDNLVYCLPFIRDQVPDIHLDIYYGFHNWKSAAQSRNNTEELARIDAMERDIERVKESVHFMDRVSQPVLAERWQQAYVWAYPTYFTETYCITAKEAQLSSTPIVCSDVAALATTVGPYGKLIADPYSREGRTALVDEVIRLHKDKDYWIQRSNQAMEGAQRVDWQSRWEDYWSKWL